MKYRILFNDHRLSGMELDKDNQSSTGKILSVLTTARTATFLKRNRRQIYRYVSKRILHPYGPFLGDWLFEKEEVLFLKRLLRELKGRLSLPKTWQPLFPEYRLRDLDWRQDADLILARVLENGARVDLKIILKVYPTSRIRLFLREKGVRDLSLKSLNFWCWCLRVSLPKPNRGTLLGQRLGGVA